MVSGFLTFPSSARQVRSRIPDAAAVQLPQTLNPTYLNPIDPKP